MMESEPHETVLKYCDHCVGDTRWYRNDDGMLYCGTCGRFDA